LNELKISGIISKLDPLRYSPANIPIRNFKIFFQNQEQKEFYKQVEFEIEAVLVGNLALSEYKEGQKKIFLGFLDRKSKKSNQLIFHIKEIN
jgi:primosomal replication protein N